MLSHQQAKTFYDRFGERQDRQVWYEDVATAALVRHLELAKAGAVFEFGCGTGRFAEQLLARHLPARARYVGIDISETMAALTRQRLARFGGRAEVHRVDGLPRLAFETAAFDRFVANYVLDLLTLEDSRMLLREAGRVLVPGGLLGLVGLTHGFTLPSRVVATIWKSVHAIRPALVGGCRPISLPELAAGPEWHIRYHDRFSRYGVPSEVLVAERVKGGQGA